MTDGYVNPDGTPWVPAFKGQRPPFQPGNTLGATEGNLLALRHGANSPRRIDPIAQQLLAELHQDPNLDYIRAQPFKARAWDWARAEARHLLLSAWVDTLPLSEAGDTSGGRTAPLELVRQLAVTAANLAMRCGLTPVVDDRVADEIDKARKRRARTAEREQLAKDLKAAIREQMYGAEQ